MRLDIEAKPGQKQSETNCFKSTYRNVEARERLIEVGVDIAIDTRVILNELNANVGVYESIRISESSRWV